jgi:hypothetical protein
MRTEKQIESEIAKLEKLKRAVPPTTAFGDDNHASIEAQIQVLRDSMHDDEIWDAWPEEESDLHVRSAAQDAVEWRDGKGEAPSEGWN